MKTNYALSIIVPCFNEEMEIKNVINRILLFSKNYALKIQIVIVNDGSTDKTSKIINLFRNNQSVVIINHKKNLGFGAAFYSGVKKSTGEYVTHLPGDNESNIEDSLLLFNETKNVDMVVPYVYNKLVRKKNRVLISSLFTKIINFTFRTSLNYTNGCVFYKTNILKEIEFKSKGFLFQTELIIKMIKKGYMYIEAPLLLDVRKQGKSKAIKLKQLKIVIIEFFKLIVDIYFKNFNKEISVNSKTYQRLKK